MCTLGLRGKRYTPKEHTNYPAEDAPTGHLHGSHRTTLPVHSTAFPLQAISAPVKCLWSAKFDTSCEFQKHKNYRNLRLKDFFLQSHIQEVIVNVLQIWKGEVVAILETFSESLSLVPEMLATALYMCTITGTPLKICGNNGFIAIYIPSIGETYLKYWRRNRNFYFFKGFIQYKDGLTWNNNTAETVGTVQW